MYGHLTCPEKLWHASDKRIGLISNPEILLNRGVFVAYKPLKKDEYCGICEVVIQYLDSLLENNATVAEIEKAVEKICNFLPKAYAQKVRAATRGLE